MVFQIFDTWRPQLFFKTIEYYNVNNTMTDFMDSSCFTFSNALLANKLMIMASQTILGII